MGLTVFLMVFLTGFTGLMYQVTWQKYLSIYLGSHALSTSLTLSGFFLFLALGYHVFGLIGHKLGKNRILAYGYVEAVIGIYAILSPKLFSFLYEVWPSFPSGTILHIVSSGGFSFLLMGIPTFLMGGTIPLLTQGLSKELSESHKVHAMIYGINTLGAFIGSLVAGFYMIEHLGLEQSLNLTGMINCLICVGLILYCKFTGLQFTGYQPPNSENKSIRVSGNKSLLTLSFISGLMSFGLESLSIRMAGLSIGSSDYTYTVIVASFIISIALGSFFASRINEERCFRWLLTSQALLFGYLIALHLMMPHMPNFHMRLRLIFSSTDINFNPYWVSVFFSFFLLLLIPVTLLGMTLPLLFQQLKNSGQFLNQTAGRMYAYNSIGGAIGALLIGYILFLFLPAHSVFLSLVVLAAISMALVFRIWQPKQTLRQFAPIGLAVLAILILPKWDDHSFVPSRFAVSSTISRAEYEKIKAKFSATHPQSEKVLYSDFGVNTYTVVTEDTKGERALYVNGKPDASTLGDKFTRTLTALIPLTLATHNADIFIIGLGTGMSAGIATSFEGTEKVKVSEIASGAINALPYFSKWNFNLDQNMEKVEIVNDDAYKVLKTEEQTYDLIFSEPSNTWVSGVEKIYTREFLNIAAKKLRPHGIYSQWFPLFAMSEDSFLSILSNFKAAFPHVTLWSAGGSATIILASNQPLTANMDSLKYKTEKMKEIYQSIKREDASDLLFHQIWSDQAITELASSATLEHSLYHPTLAFQSGRSYFSNQFVNIGSVAEKHFTKPEAEASSNSSRQLSSTEPDLLLWQTVQSQLSNRFFTDGMTFTKDVHPIVYGKMEVASIERSIDKPTKMLEDAIRLTDIKNKQIQYLMNDKPKFEPEKLSSKSYLPQELFAQFLKLRSMREPANLKNITAMIPSTCQDANGACYRLKLEVLFYLGAKKADELSKIAAGIKKGEKAILDSVEEDFNKANMLL